MTEAVEVCPHCETENVFENYDVKKEGYEVTCQHCGEKIMLCDECSHAWDNLGGFCDWENGKCFRSSL